MYEVFNLKLVSTSGVFDKYVVLGLEIKDIVIRAYRITEIFRAFNADIDEEATGDNTITQIACPVGQEWYALTENGKVRYIVNETEYITITSKHVGFIRYLDGGLWVWSKDMTDSHYVAFSTDKQMDNLYEAELVYSYDKYTRFCSTNPFDSADRLTLQATAENVHKTLNKYEDSVNVDNILFNDDYSYNRIQRVEEFKAKESEKFTEGTEESLDGKQWVLRFFESDYSYMYNYVSSDVPGLAYSMETTSWTTVRDVGLLRLTYEYGGKVYDMGVVDNLTQGDEVPDNENPYEPEYPDWLGKIKDLIITCILIFGACIILSVIPGIGAIFGLVFSVILKGVGLGFKGLFWFIGLPFRLIGKLFKRKKRDK